MRQLANKLKIGLLAAFVPLFAVAHASDLQQSQLSLVANSAAIAIPAWFTGLSYEKRILAGKLFRGNNSNLQKLLRRLGPGILRVGGNSVDKVDWNKLGPGGQNGKIAPRDLRNLRNFLRGTPWKVLYGINLGHNTPAIAADEAAAAAEIFGDQLLGFEIGNEPDIYPTNGLRPSTYSYADFKKEWETYSAAILARVPGALLTGPLPAGDTDGYSLPFANDEAGKFHLLTQHYYKASGANPSSTQDILLAPDSYVPTNLGRLVQAAKQAGISGGYRTAECGPFWSATAQGLNNGFGTALWAIDYMFANVMAGSMGVNFHGGGDSTAWFTPIANDGNGNIEQIRPIYYAMRLFAEFRRGAVLTTQLQTTSAINYSTYAVRDQDGSLWLVLNNKDRHVSMQTTLFLSRSFRIYDTFALNADTLESTDGFTFGGTPIGPDGAWHPIRRTNAFRDGHSSVVVPPASAVLVHVHGGTKSPKRKAIPANLNAE